MDDVIRGLQEDASKLRRMTTGNRELDTVAQILVRMAGVLAEVEQRVRALEGDKPARKPPKPPKD